MRRFLLLLLLLAISGTAAEAAWPLPKRKPSFDTAAARKAISSLAPTTAEKAAISGFRKKANISYQLQSFAGQQDAAPDTLRLPTEPAPMPPACDPQISVEFRFLTMKEPLAQAFMSHPALAWSGLPTPLPTAPATPHPPAVHGVVPVSLQLQKPQTPAPASLWESDASANPGMSTASSGVRMPLLVRLMEEKTAFKLLEIISEQQLADTLQAPKITVFSGQMGSVQDSSQTPFVTSILPVEGTADAVAYQPVIQIVNEGINITLGATLLEDFSCRLDVCRCAITKIVETNNIKIVAGQSEKPRKQDADETSKAMSDVTIQVPVVSQIEVNIPAVIVPKEMALLVAMPGIKQGDNQMFLLVTPRGILPEEETVASSTATL